jgi:hypothetical protein
MKTLLKIAVGAAVAGYFINLLLKKGSAQSLDDSVGMGAAQAEDSPSTAEDGDSRRDWKPEEAPVH